MKKKSPAASEVQSRWPYWTLVFALVLVALSYGGVVHNEFLNWDDDVNYLSNRDFIGLNAHSLQWALKTQILGVYQPTAWIILSIQSAVDALNPAVFHAASVLLYAAVVVATFLAFRTLEQFYNKKNAAAVSNSPASYLVLTLLAVHPLRVEVIAWASSQPYIVCAIFYMLGVAAYLKWRMAPKQWRWWSAALLCYLLCVTSKAAGISLPLVFLVGDYFLEHRRDFVRMVTEKLPFFGLAGASAMWAMAARAHENAIVGVEQVSPLIRFLMSAYAICFYAIKTVLPTNLSNFYPLPPVVSPRNPVYALSWMALLALSIYLVAKRKQRPGLVAGVLAAFVAVMPTLSFVRFSMLLAADRYSFIPSLMIALMLAMMVRNVKQTRYATAGLIVAICVYGYAAQARVKIWHDSGTLWADAIAKSPEPIFSMAVAHNNLGSYLEAHDDLAGAEEHYRIAIKCYPDSGISYNNLGLLLAKQRKFEEALALLKKGTELAPNDPGFLANYADKLGAAGQLSLSEQLFRQALAKDPNSAKVNHGLAGALVLLAKATHNPQTWSEAKSYFEKAINLDPSLEPAYSGLATLYDTLGDAKNSEATITLGIQRNPRSAELHYNLGVLIHRRGEISAALEQFKQSIALDPQYAPAQQAMKLVAAQQTTPSAEAH